MRERITKRKLIELVAEASEYHKYEVEDILNTFYDVIREELEDGNEIEIPKILRFYLEKPKPRIITSGYTKKTFLSPAYVRIKFKPITTYTTYLEREFNGNVFIDRTEEKAD